MRRGSRYYRGTPAEVCFGSHPDLDPPKCEVRFAPINGYRQLGAIRPISATAELMHRSNKGVLFDHPIDASVPALIQATPLSEDPQSAAAGLMARPKRSMQML